MNEPVDFIKDVRRNCDISDARSAGLYSICGLALRLRDLYKWEHHLNPWEEKDASQILDWIGDKESLWERIAENDFKDLTLLGKQYDPFDTQTINAELVPMQIFYGAGYAHALKPTFFLSKIRETRTLEGHTVHVLGEEYARDLLTIPALTQDGCVVFRHESARLYLWDQMTYLKKSGRPALDFALRHCGLPDNNSATLRGHLDTILSYRVNTYIYHELGELKDDIFPVDTWREIIAEYAQTPVELFARAVKDLLADTLPCGTIPQIIKERNAVAIGFYAAFIDGLSKTLFPELRPAFDSFSARFDWNEIRQATDTGLNTARKCANDLIAIFKEGKIKKDMDWARKEIFEALIQPRIESGG
jgi:hypothetical protein